MNIYRGDYCSFYVGLIRFYSLDLQTSSSAVWRVRRGTPLLLAGGTVHVNLSRSSYFVMAADIIYPHICAYCYFVILGHSFGGILSIMTIYGRFT